MVEIHDLHVRFHGASREAVAGIDLTIRDGEVVGLVGESGSGKTVTAMTLSGLIERKRSRSPARCASTGAISYACPARSCAPSRAVSSALSFRSR